MMLNAIGPGYIAIVPVGLRRVAGFLVGIAAHKVEHADQNGDRLDEPLLNGS
jgi:hypothetical protein